MTSQPATTLESFGVASRLAYVYTHQAFFHVKSAFVVLHCRRVIHLNLCFLFSVPSKQKPQHKMEDTGFLFVPWQRTPDSVLLTPRVPFAAVTTPKYIVNQRGNRRRSTVMQRLVPLALDACQARETTQIACASLLSPDKGR